MINIKAIEELKQKIEALIQELTREFFVTLQTEIVTEDLTVLANCQEIAFRNEGLTNVKILGYTLQPKESVNFSNNNPRMLDKTAYRVSFENGKGILIVIKKHVQ